MCVCVALWIDNGNTFSVQGGSFRSRLSPPDRRGESKDGSWKWPCHMGNYSTLRSERTHKASLPPAALAGQPLRRPGATAMLTLL